MYFVGTHLKLFNKVILISTHNVCFQAEIRKNIHNFWLKKIMLSEAMPYLELWLTQILIVASSDPVTHLFVIEFHLTHVTSASWPCNVFTKVILEPFMENFLI